MKKKFLDDMDMPAASKPKSAKKAPPWLAESGDDAAEDDVLEDGMPEDDAAPAESDATEEAGASAGALAEISDDDLLAEVEKRGLSAGGDAADASPEAEDDEEEFA